MLARLKERLLAPDLFREFAEEVQRELEARTRDFDRERVRLEREMAAIKRKIEAMLKAIEDGFYNPSMKERIAGSGGIVSVVAGACNQLDLLFKAAA